MAETKSDKEQYELSEAGKAYLAKAKDEKAQEKGIINTRVDGVSTSINIQSINQEQMKVLHTKGSPYIQLKGS